MTELQTSLQELRQLGVEISFERDSVLWQEGEAGDHCVLVLDGELSVVHDGPEGRMVFRTLRAGTLAGEMACLDGLPRSATVVATSPTRVLRIGAPELRSLLRLRPDILEELFWQQVDRVRDLTRQVTSSQKKAITDTLTKLYNFGFFRERLNLELDRARETGDPVSLVIFDIDHFKHYNDTHGHLQGNEALIHVAKLIRNAGRRGDIIARYGGEEFVALLYGATRTEANGFAQAICRAVASTPFQGSEQQPLGHLSISGGVATFPEDASTEDRLIAAADARLYEAKRGGRNRIVAEG